MEDSGNYPALRSLLLEHSCTPGSVLRVIRENGYARTQRWDNGKLLSTDRATMETANAVFRDVSRLLDAQGMASKKEAQIPATELGLSGIVQVILGQTGRGETLIISTI